ncbi:S41 family peptidase [Tengunoibacter tsumagoiensis]|uniref:Carboxyl-terminal processing protease n=1 Tax=Tengunoibacter tsumagoiensis TaxID=2014871 RepID=A0A401ZYY7_9CHLR|nr:S41 family peptidase [Tengunoibacter tsumagoiensis]GCE12051.1 carboxyl-terminal processing protease [Tengunoibacter tsumagoiensis]
MSRYDDPSWYEQQHNPQQPLSSQQVPDDFEHYPFLPNGAGSPTRASLAPTRIERFQQFMKRAVGILALVAVAFFAGWFGHQYFGSYFTQGDQSRYYSDLFQQAWDQVDQNYVDRKAVDYKKMSYAAITAMVNSLQDTGHSRFMDPQTVSSENQQLSGKFTGIGIYLHQDPTTKQLIITSAVPGAPADKAGIKPNDIIVGVDGKNTVGKDVGGVSALIQGKEGTDVTLTIQRPGVDHTLDIKMTRAEISAQNVILHYIPESHIAHIQITQFSDGVSNQLKDALAKAKGQGATKIILDMRDNPGGYLPEAVNTASLFLKDGNVLLEQDNKGNRTPTPVNGKPVNTTDQLVVLVNENSASAAEIVTGALQDNKRATVFGKKTFGTGTVLSQINLSDGSALLLGVREWLTPNGRFIRQVPNDPNSGGIIPDHPVNQPANAITLTPNEENQANMTLDQILSSNDAQLKAAIQYLQGK